MAENPLIALAPGVWVREDAHVDFFDHIHREYQRFTQDIEDEEADYALALEVATMEWAFHSETGRVPW